MNAAQLDENLILRIAGGDQGAFRELYQQTSGAVYGFALSILKNRHDAEDVMHDAYLRTYAAAVTYEPKGKPLAWILTIVRNLSYNKLRSGRMNADIDAYHHLTEDGSGTAHISGATHISGAVDASGAVDVSGTADDRMVLEKAMEILDFQERQIVILHALTGMKHREIGQLLDLPTGTVLSKYNRALKKVRNELEEKGVQR